MEPSNHRPYAILLYSTYLCRQSLMSSIPTTLFKSFFQDGGHKQKDRCLSWKKLQILALGLHIEMCLAIMLSAFWIEHTVCKKTDNINRLNRARSHTDGGNTIFFMSKHRANSNAFCSFVLRWFKPLTSRAVTGRHFATRVPTYQYPAGTRLLGVSCSGL